VKVSGFPLLGLLRRFAMHKHDGDVCVATWREKGGSQCSKMSLFSSLRRWRLRSYVGAVDLRFVGDVDHGYDSGRLFATSVGAEQSG